MVWKELESILRQQHYDRAVGGATFSKLTAGISSRTPPRTLSTRVRQGRQDAKEKEKQYRVESPTAEVRFRSTAATGRARTCGHDTFIYDELGVQPDSRWQSEPSHANQLINQVARPLMSAAKMPAPVE